MFCDSVLDENEMTDVRDKFEPGYQITRPDDLHQTARPENT